MPSNDNDEMASLEIAIVAEAFASAACTSGTRVKMIDGTAVVVMGEASDEEVASFAARGVHFDDEELAAHFDNGEFTGFFSISDGKSVRTFNRAEWAEYLNEWAEYLKQKSQ